MPRRGNRWSEPAVRVAIAAPSLQGCGAPLANLLDDPSGVGQIIPTTFITVFQFLAVPAIPSFFSITTFVNFDFPIPSG